MTKFFKILNVIKNKGIFRRQLFQFFKDPIFPDREHCMNKGILRAKFSTIFIDPILQDHEPLSIWQWMEILSLNLCHFGGGVMHDIPKIFIFQIR